MVSVGTDPYTIDINIMKYNICTAYYCSYYPIGIKQSPIEHYIALPISLW